MTLSVGVSFEGVMARYEGWEDGDVKTAPVAGAIPGLKMLMELFAVFIFTSREPMSVLEWLFLYAPEIEVAVERTPLADGTLWADNFERVFWGEQGKLLITRRKLPAVAYLDDRAVRFDGSWPGALLYLDAAVKESELRRMHA
jgi:hypothetical protein